MFILVKFEYGSSGGLSVCPSTLSLYCDNWNPFLQRTFILCIWVIYQIRRTLIVFGVIMSEVKVTGRALPDLVCILVHLQLSFGTMLTQMIFACIMTK